MCAAASAQPQLPDIAGKPGKLAAPFASNLHTRGLMKTADIKEQACGVEKDVLVPALDKGRFLGTGQGKSASAAADRADGFVSYLAVLLPMGRRALTAPGERPAGALAQAITSMGYLCGGC